MLWAHRAGVKNVVTALLPAVPTGVARLRLGARRAIARRLIDPRWNELVDALVVVSDEQRRVACSYFGFERRKVNVIPNIVAEQFWTATRDVSQGGYLLCSGNISPRKGQLDLVLASAKASLPLVLVGGRVPGEERYFDLVMSAVQRAGATYVGELEPSSQELVDVYTGAKAFVLLSRSETQPVSVLEAAVVGLPIGLLRQPYTAQAAFRGALRFSDPSPETVAEGLLSLMASGAVQHGLDRAMLQACRAEAAGSAARSLYEGLFADGSGCDGTPKTDPPL